MLRPSDMTAQYSIRLRLWGTGVNYDIMQANYRSRIPLVETEYRNVIKSHTCLRGPLSPLLN
jgi:G:T-mismatch repair DNA endonuclease (very short patch repair protein)